MGTFREIRVIIRFYVGIYPVLPQICRFLASTSEKIAGNLRIISRFLWKTRFFLDFLAKYLQEIWPLGNKHGDLLDFRLLTSREKPRKSLKIPIFLHIFPKFSGFLQ